MKATIITIRTRRSKHHNVVEHSIPAYVDECFPGLAVHREFEGKNWMVTHTATGLSATRGLTYDTRAEAKDVATKMASVLDWTQSADEIRKFSLETLDKLRVIWYGVDGLS